METLNTAVSNEIKDTPLPSEFVAKALGALPERAREIVKKRFGLDGAETVSLEQIGRDFKITRERVRQIKKEAIGKIQAENAPEISNFGALFLDLMNQNGAVAEQNFFLDQIIGIIEKKYPGSNFEQEKRNLVLVLLLFGRIKRNSADKKLKSVFYANDEAIRIAKSAIARTISFFKSTNGTMSEEELFAKMSEAGFGGQNITPRAFGSYIRISQEIARNPFRQWGLVQWPRILPRNVRDKAYLAALSKKSPLHFKEMAGLIGEIWKGRKRSVLAETAHNELIKDKRFVLVGRGIYALAEWGYEKGTVGDIIKNVLAKANRPMSREEIVKNVSSQRLVKPGTIILNLKNGEIFEKTKEGMYKLK